MNESYKFLCTLTEQEGPVEGAPNTNPMTQVKLAKKMEINRIKQQTKPKVKAAILQARKQIQQLKMNSKDEINKIRQQDMKLIQNIRNETKIQIDGIKEIMNRQIQLIKAKYQ